MCVLPAYCWYVRVLQEDLEELRQRWRIMPAPESPQNDPARSRGNPMPPRAAPPPPPHQQREEAEQQPGVTDHQVGFA